MIWSLLGILAKIMCSICAVLDVRRTQTCTRLWSQSTGPDERGLGLRSWSVLKMLPWRLPPLFQFRAQVLFLKSMICLNVLAIRWWSVSEDRLWQLGKHCSCFFWHCSFVLSLWEWFQGLADRVTGDRTWSVGHGFVLYGVDPHKCSVGVLRRLHFVSVTLKKHI